MKMNGNAIHFIRARINYTVIINFHSSTLHFMQTVKHYSELGDDPVIVMNK